MSAFSVWALRGTDVNGRIYVVDSTGVNAGIQINLTNNLAGLNTMLGIISRSMPMFGSVSSDTDPQVGFRVFMNPTAGVDGDLAGSTEITIPAINQVRRTTSGALLAGVLTVDRLAHDTIIEVDANGLLQPLATLTIEGIQAGDTVELYALTGTSFTLTPGAGNINSGVVGADYTSAGSAQRIKVEYNGTDYDEISRVEQQPVSVTDLRAASIPASPVGITSLALVNGGLVSTINPDTQSHEIRLTGSGYVLAGNNTLSGTNLGDEIVGDTLKYFGNGATATYAGGSIIVAGKTVPANVALTGNWAAEVICVSIGPAVWVCKAIEADFSTTQFVATAHIVDLNVTTGKINDLAVTTGKVADLAVTGAKIAANTIDASAKVQAGTVTLGLLDPAVQAALGSNIVVGSLTIATADVLLLNATPQQLVAAPGVGFTIVPIQASIAIAFNAAAYTTNLTLQIYNDTASSAPVFQNANTLDAGASVHHVFTASAAAPSSTIQLVENQPLMIRVATGNPAVGDSDITIYFSYRIVQL